MSYVYQRQRAELHKDPDFTQKIIRYRDKVLAIIDQAGCIRMDKMLPHAEFSSSWEMMACADYLVEINTLIEVTDKTCAGQYRIFEKKVRS